MVKPLFNIVVIKAEYYEVYAEFGLLSCEHKIFNAQEWALPLFFLPFCSWLWQYGFLFRSEATKVRGELEKNGKTLILVLIPPRFWHYLWLCI